LQTLCLGWPQTAILLISASWVVRIIGVSHQLPAKGTVLENTATSCSAWNSHSSSPTTIKDAECVVFKAPTEVRTSRWLSWILHQTFKEFAPTYVASSRKQESREHSQLTSWSEVPPW
jgi:NAD-dependent oxidoreductase involved in siderophore biosynthesis